MIHEIKMDADGTNIKEIINIIQPTLDGNLATIFDFQIKDAKTIVLTIQKA